MRPQYILAAISACSLAAASQVTAGVVLSPPPDISGLVIDAPTPEYPDDFQRRRIGGTGVFLLRVQIKSGRVSQVLIGQSTGAPPLDAFAVKALRAWRFKPGAVPYRKITSVRMSPPQTEGETLVKVPVMFR
jgi:TonB family protein